MGFTNEYASASHVLKYQLAAINENYQVVAVDYDWTADIERGMYLRWIKSGREGEANRHTFNFLWQWKIMELVMVREGEGVRGGEGWTRWTIERLALLPNRSPEKEQALADLKAALEVFGDFGSDSATAEHRVQVIYNGAVL